MRQWNPKTFFRHLTPEVLDLFCEWSKLELRKEGEGSRAERVYKAWSEIPDDTRMPIEKQLYAVNDLCGPHARPYLEELAGRVWRDEPDKISAARDWTAQDLAVRLFIRDPVRFDDTAQTYAVDLLDHVKEYRGAWTLTVRPSDDIKLKIKAAMEDHFRGTAEEGTCVVEGHSNAERFAFWIYYNGQKTPEDRVTPAGKLETEFRRPLIRYAAVFHYDSHTLSIKAPDPAERDWLRGMFAKLIADDATYFSDPSKENRYNFEVLKDQKFMFQVSPMEGIQVVSLIQVTAKSPHRAGRNVVVNIEPGEQPYVARQVLETHGISLDTAEIRGIQLQFTFTYKGMAKNRTVSVRNPGSTNLNDSIRDRLIRKYLKKWGIDATAHRVAVAANSRGASAA
jgi:hypothetical protein